LPVPALVQQILVFAIIAAVLAALWREWLAAELAALGGMAVLLATGVLSAESVARSFSNTALLTVGCMFVLSAALERTGVIEKLGDWFTKAARNSERRAFVLILGIPLGLSPFVNNTPIVVILMPVVLAFCRSSGVKPSKLLIPLSFASILGGTCSLIGTSTNLLVDGIARDLGQPAFRLFEILPLGILYAVAGCLYLFFIGRRLLPSRDTLSTLLDPEMRRDYLVQAMVSKGSPLIGKTVDKTDLARTRGIKILEVKRHGIPQQVPLNELELAAGDRLLLRAGTRAVQTLREAPGINVGWEPELGLEALEERKATLVEAILGTNSSLIGKTIRQSHFRERYGAIIVALHRQGVNLKHDFENVPLAFGDVLLIEGQTDSVARLVQTEHFVNLSEPNTPALRKRKAPVALGCMAGFIVFGILGVDAFTLAFLAAIVVTMTGCVRPSEAYAAIEWRILFLIAGMLGIGEALGSTGGAALIANALTEGFAPLGPVALVAVLYFLASFLTEIISNNAVAILLTPIALQVSETAGCDPRGLLVAIMFGASASFATPVGYQTNTYVFGAGGYRFRDFLKIGVPLNLLMWLVASLAIPWIWPLFP